MYQNGSSCQNAPLGGHFGYFFIFCSVSGAGKGRRRSLRQKGAGTFYLEIERGAGFSRRGGGVVRHGARRVLRGGGGG